MTDTELELVEQLVGRLRDGLPLGDAAAGADPAVVQLAVDLAGDLAAAGWLADQAVPPGFDAVMAGVAALGGVGAAGATAAAAGGAAGTGGAGGAAAGATGAAGAGAGTVGAVTGGAAAGAAAAGGAAAGGTAAGAGMLGTIGAALGGAGGLAAALVGISVVAAGVVAAVVMGGPSEVPELTQEPRVTVPAQDVGEPAEERAEAPTGEPPALRERVPDDVLVPPLPEPATDAEGDEAADDQDAGVADPAAGETLAAPEAVAPPSVPEGGDDANGTPTSPSSPSTPSSPSVPSTTPGDPPPSTSPPPSDGTPAPPPPAPDPPPPAQDPAPDPEPPPTPPPALPSLEVEASGTPPRWTFRFAEGYDPATATFSLRPQNGKVEDLGDGRFRWQGPPGLVRGVAVPLGIRVVFHDGYVWDETVTIRVP